MHDLQKAICSLCGFVLLVGAIFCLPASAAKVELDMAIAAIRPGPGDDLAATRIHDMAVDTDGSIYSVGTFFRSVDFDPDPGVQLWISRRQHPLVEYTPNAFISKVDSSGRLLWVRTSWPGDTEFFSDDSIKTVDLSPQGNVYVHGSFPENHQIYDLRHFVLDGNSNILKKGPGYGGAGPVRFFSLHPNGGYVTNGSFDANVGIVIENLDTPLSRVLAGPQPGNYIVRHAANDSVLWAIAITVQSTNPILPIIPDDMKLDPFGNVLVLGRFHGNVDFDPGPNMFEINYENELSWVRAIFIAKYSPAGSLIWAKAIGGDDPAFSNLVSSYSPRGLDTDIAGNVYVAGEISGTVDIDPGPGTYIVNAESIRCAMVVKLTPGGEFVWGTTAGSGTSRPPTVDEDGNVYLWVEGGEGRDFDPGPGEALVPEGEGTLGVLWKLGANGEFKWMRYITGEGGSADENVAPDFIRLGPDKSVHIAGYTEGTATFGPAAEGVVNGPCFFIARYAQVVGPTLTLGEPSTLLTKNGPVTIPLAYEDASSIEVFAESIALNKTGTANADLNVSAVTASGAIITLSNITGDGSLSVTLPKGSVVDEINDPAPDLGPSTPVVVDNSGPNLVLQGPNPVTVAPDIIYIDRGAFAVDAREGDVSHLLVTDSTVDTSTLGTYHVTYSASDSLGNTSPTITRTVIVDAPTAIQTETIDETGGEVSRPGIEVIVPEGAVDEPTEVAVLRVEPEPGELPGGLSHVPGTHVFEVEGLDEVTEIDVELAYPDANQDGIVDGTVFAEADLVLILFNPDNGEWTIVLGDVDTLANIFSTTITAEHLNSINADSLDGILMYLAAPTTFDVNGDNAINILDLQLIVNAILQIATPQVFNTDIDGDAQTDLFDLVMWIDEFLSAKNVVANGG